MALAVPTSRRNFQGFPESRLRKRNVFSVRLVNQSFYQSWNCVSRANCQIFVTIRLTGEGRRQAACKWAWTKKEEREERTMSAPNLGVGCALIKTGDVLPPSGKVVPLTAWHSWWRLCQGRDNLPALSTLSLAQFRLAFAALSLKTYTCT